MLVNLIATLLDVKDHPVESVDAETLSHLEARVVDSTLSSTSSLDEQALLRRLWQELKELATEQRDVCFGFEDESGRDLFTVLLEGEIVNLRELAEELGRSTEAIVELWSKMPMDDKAIAVEMKTTRAQVYKWRLRLQVRFE